MHALLCYSASHLKHINSDSTDYDQSIVVHKHHALSLLRAELDSWDTPNPPMNDAAFGTGVILAIQSLGTFKSNSASYPTDLEWIPLMTGFRSLVDNWHNMRGPSIFFPLLTAYEHPKENTKEEEDAFLRKFSLEKIPGQLPPSYSRHISKLAVQLAPYFPDDHYSNPPPTCSRCPSPGIPWTRTLRQLLAWFATLPDSFVPRAKEGDPAILLVLWWVFTLLRELHGQQSTTREPLWWIERVAKEGVEDMKRAVQN
jgi:Fungal specific transcription factor domain